MAKERREPTDPTVEEPEVFQPEHEASAPAADHVVVEDVPENPPVVAAAAADPEQVLDPHPTRHAHDEELAAQEERIADLERQIEEEKRNQRMHLVDEERRLYKENLDNREAGLLAQLARVRGEEPHEE